MYKTKIKIFLAAGLVSLSYLSLAQVSKSPFTSRGIGDINNLSLAHNQGMGGVGLSNGSYWYLNNMNPALLPNNTLTVFGAGLVMERRTLSNNSTKETNGGGSLGYLATAFPVKPGRWTTSVGLSPFSTVDYSFTFEEQVTDTVFTDITEAGSGGFSQVYWANGVRLNDNFSVGVKATYLFSSIETSFSNQIKSRNSDDPVNLQPTVLDRTSVSDFLFQGSFAFKKDSIFNNKIRFNAGFTYDFASEVNANQLKSTELQLDGAPITNDTLSSNENGSIYLPKAFGGGISFNNGIKWAVGLDATYRPWSEYKNFEGVNEGLEDAYTVALGGEYTPDPSSVSSYLKRVTYRLGLSYENTPYVIDGNQVKDFGINFGWSLPVSRFSSLDMAFKYGQRGKISETRLDEEYFRFTLGVNFNDQWFIKRKYD
ncbi:hypothetical protein E1176_14090 [Fulvivirga sp. RKSG066]|uniref:hypothetical protein n=1 Tax=Fulvivirga aurantia TaxID=2529383 RepID=UPI0012BD6E24|nr:hypothetical protein [Fulvivirga aurantia]MTI22157.1 hypothetical protein [Fulvivirga aurantia]